MPPQDMHQVLGRLQSLSRLSELKIEEFACEEGLADIIVQQLRRDLKAAQLRKFYGLMKRVDRDLRGKEEEEAFPQEIRPKLLRILPLLAYAKGRGLIPKGFYDAMKSMLDMGKIQHVKDFRTLIQFMEAVVAYHKYREE